LRLLDLKRNADTTVSVDIEYKYCDAALSTREVVTITEFKGESLVERTVDHCGSV